LTRRVFWVQMGTLLPAHPARGRKGTTRTDLGVGVALVSTWPITRSSSTLRSCSGPRRLNERKTHLDDSFPWTWMALMITVLLCRRAHYTFQIDANFRVSAVVRCPLSTRFLHASQRLLPCLHTSVNCG